MDVCAWAEEVRRQGCMLVNSCEELLCPAFPHDVSDTLLWWESRQIFFQQVLGVIIGSAEALPILCVSDFCERERERERDACDVIDITLKSRYNHAYDYLDGAQTQRVDAFGACRALELRSACKENRSLALERSIEQQGRVIDERRWGSGSFAFAGQTAVDHPAAFRWHASSKKNRPS